MLSNAWLKPCADVVQRKQGAHQSMKCAARILTGFISPVSFQTTPDDPIMKRVETVGRVRPHVKAKIVDPEGNIVPIETPGELLVSGYLVQKG